MTTSAKRQLRLTTFKGLPDDLAQPVLWDFAGPPAAVAGELTEALLETLDEQTDSYRWLTIRCEPTPTSKERTKIASAVSSALEEAEWAEIDEGWEGERVEFDKAFQPALAYCRYEYEDSVAGFWYDDDTFVVTVFDLSQEPTGLAQVSAAHWHPGSRTSGSWRDSFTLVASGLGLSHHYKDEDGCYLQFERVSAATTAAAAAALGSAVTSWELFGAEWQLVRAYFLGFSGGNVETLGGWDNPGYEIERFSIAASPELLEELEHQNPAPTPAESREWLAEIGESSECDDIEDVDECFLLGNDHLVKRLREIADSADHGDDSK